jgi:hypothetical protein
MSQRVRGRQRASTSGKPRPAPGRQQPETYSKRALFQIAGPRNSTNRRRQGASWRLLRRATRSAATAPLWQNVANIGTRDLLRARDGGEKVGKGYEHTLSVWCGRDRVEVPAWRLRYARCTMMDARCQRGGSLRARHDGDSSSGYAMRQLQLSLLFEPCRVMLLAQTRALCRATGNVDIHGHKHL